MARPSVTEERRLQIVLAMKRVVGRAGLEGASIAEIAREARLAPGLLHHHFDSKRAMTLMLIDVLELEAIRQLDPATSVGKGTPADTLDGALERLLGRGAGADPAAVGCWVSLSVEALRDAEVQRRYSLALGRLRNRFEELLGGLPPKRRKEGAAAIIALLNGYFILSASAPDLVPKGSAARTARLMTAALVAQRRAS